MPDPLSADRTAELLLWYFKEPGRYGAEGRRRNAPLLDSEVVLKLVLGRRVDFVVPPNDAQAVVTLQQAAAAYVRHHFFHPDATPYQVLGLAPGASPQAIKESFRLLMQLVHPDRQDARVIWPDAFAARANRAYAVLRDQDSRARFDREAESRAALARSMHRAAAAAAASKMPVVLRPRPRFGERGLLRRLTWPDWLTTGVGGYACEHPATVAFSVLIGVAALTVGAFAWERKEGWLTREVQESETPPASTVRVATRVSATVAEWVAGAFEPAASPGTGASPKRTTLPQPMALNADSTAATPNGSPPRTSGAPEPPVIAATGGPLPQATPMLASVAATGAEMTHASTPTLPSENGVPAGRPTPPETFAPAPVPATTKSEHDPPPPLQTAGASIAAALPAPVLAPAPAVANAPVSVAPVGAPSARAEQVALVTVSAVPPLPPATTEIETLFAAFVETYERGRIDAFVALFDADADSNLRHGRAAIRGEYDELFRLSQWRKMQLTRVNWKRLGDRAVAKGEITVRIGWRDGREVEQRLAVDMELVRRDGRVVIARLSQQPKN